MEDRTILARGITIGLDLGDKYSQYCMLGRDGQVVQEGRIRTMPEALRKFLSSMDPCRVAIEAGTHSPWVSRLVKEASHEVVVANPRKVRLIYQNDNKTDQRDAQYLARVARLDPSLLFPLHHRGAAAQADLAIIRARHALVEARTKLINHIRGAVKSVGGRLPASSSHVFARKVKDSVPAELRPALIPIFETIQELTNRIDQMDRQVEELAEQYPAAKNLQQVDGVGPLTSVSYILTLEDPGRFKNSRAVGSYLGLRPRSQESGESAPQLRITKAGDTYLRQLLVSCAHYILGPFGPDTDLSRWGMALAARGGKNAKKRAVVAVARKLAVLLHRLWVTGQAYDPLRNAARQPQRQQIRATGKRKGTAV
jgi:transposase